MVHAQTIPVLARQLHSHSYSIDDRTSRANRSNDIKENMKLPQPPGQTNRN